MCDLTGARSTSVQQGHQVVEVAIRPLAFEESSLVRNGEGQSQQFR